DSELPFHSFYRGFGEYYLKKFDGAGKDFDRAYELDRALLQAQIGKGLSHGIRHQESKGLEILRAADRRIQARGVGDSEAIYKLAQAYAVLGDKTSALRMLQHTVDHGFFPYPYFASDPLLDSLRSDAHFEEISQKARQRHEEFKKNFF